MQAIIQRGQIWNALVPFNESANAKDRPAVVVGWSGFGKGEDHNVLMVPVSTFGGDASKAKIGDIPLSNYEACGLSSGSFIRTRRLMSLHPSAIRFDDKPKGTLVEADLSTMLLEIEKMFAVKGLAQIPTGN